MNLFELIVDEMKHRWQLYVMLLLPVAYIIIFCYIPMSGVLMAFQDFSIRRGIFGSQWVGLKVFKQVFSNPQFPIVLRNTLLLSIYGFIAGFPTPIILALSLNECRSAKFRKTVQMLTYMPYFISTVVMVSMMTQLLHVRHGLINRMIVMFGGECGAKVFKSDTPACCENGFSIVDQTKPEVVMEAVDPMILAAKIVDTCTCCRCDAEPGNLPSGIF